MKKKKKTNVYANAIGFTIFILFDFRRQWSADPRDFETAIVILILCFYLRLTSIKNPFTFLRIVTYFDINKHFINTFWLLDILAYPKLDGTFTSYKSDSTETAW